jgi:hypothetical protein
VHPSKFIFYRGSARINAGITPPLLGIPKNGANGHLCGASSPSSVSSCGTVVIKVLAPPPPRQQRPTCRRRGRGGHRPREDREDKEDAATIMTGNRDRVNCALFGIPLLPRMARICADKSSDHASLGNAKPQPGGFHSGFRADKKSIRDRLCKVCPCAMSEWFLHFSYCNVTKISYFM